MATTTPRIGLTKPDGTDLVDIAVLNTNFDKIDSNIASTKIQSTKPTTANDGDLWWDSDTGTLYLYYTDANSSQWVAATSDPINIGVVANQTERDAQYPTPAQGMSVYRTDLGVTQRYYSLFNSSTNPGGRDTAGWYDTEKSQGLVPVKPSAVDLYGGGSASVSAIGEIVFSGATGLGLKNIFSTNYRNYRIIISGLKSASGNAELHMRFLDSSGGSNSNTNYFITGFIVYGGSTGPINQINESRYIATFGFGTADTSRVILEIENPNISGRTQIESSYSGYAGSNQHGTLGGFFDNTTQHYGVAFYASTGTQISGQVTIYGYNK